MCDHLRSVLLCAAMLLLLTGCTVPAPPEQVTETRGGEIPETSAPDTLPSDTSDTETNVPDTLPPDTSDTETRAPDTLPPETTDVPATTVPETDAPFPIPEGMTTNITDASAVAVLWRIAEVFSAYDSAAVYFTDVSGRYSFGIREDAKFHSASTIKAPYCLWLTESGQDMTQEIAFSASVPSRTSSSGALTKDAVGQSFTLGELIGYTLRYSDNQAYRLLYETFGTADYDRYVKDHGWRSLRLGTGDEWASLTARDLSLSIGSLAVHAAG